MASHQQGLERPEKFWKSTSQLKDEPRFPQHQARGHSGLAGGL